MYVTIRKVRNGNTTPQKVFKKKTKEKKAPDKTSQPAKPTRTKNKHKEKIKEPSGGIVSEEQGCVFEIKDSRGNA